MTQDFADKEFYLVDSLVLKELSKGDKELIEKCLKAYHTANYDTIKAMSIYDLVEGCSDDNVWPAYNLWLNNFLAKKIKNDYKEEDLKALSKLYARSIGNIGYAKQYIDGDLISAMDYYQKSYSILKQLNDMKGMAVSLNNIGVVLDHQGDIPKALEYLRQSLDIRYKLKDKLMLAPLLNNLGRIYDDQGDSEQALKYYKEALDIELELGNEKTIAIIYNNLGSIYDDLGDYIKALDFHHLSLKIKKKLGDKKGMAF